MTLAKRKGLVLALGLAAALAVALAGTRAPARAGASPASCPPIMPLSEVARGMTGTGLTVSAGRERERFGVEVLGVLPRALGPGRDAVIVNLSGPAIERAGGVWDGMSGSPVFVEGKLLGAVSFGLASGPSSVAGVTPAEQMLALLPASSRAGSVAARPSSIGLPPARAARIGAASGRSLAGGGTRLVPLGLPLSVSGLSSDRLAMLERALGRGRLSLIPYFGAAARGATRPVANPSLEAGDSIAAVSSYGDVSVAAVGTVTAVCGDKLLAFGHPFMASGSTTLGANAVDVLAVVRDPVEGPFKLARLGEPLGTIERDGAAGVSGTLGTSASPIPIISTIATPGTSEPRVSSSSPLQSTVVPLVALLHVAGNLDATLDAIGRGTARLTWTVTGRRAHGGPWRLSRTNLFTSEEDIAQDAPLELADDLAALLANGFDDVVFTGVYVKARVETTIRQYQLWKVLVAVDGRHYREPGRALVVRPGATLKLRVSLSRHDSRARRVVNMRLQIPNEPGGGVIRVGGGGERVSGLFGSELAMVVLASFGDASEDAEDDDVRSFGDLLHSLQTEPTNNTLVAQLQSGESRAVRVLDQVVQGSKSIRYFAVPARGDSGDGDSFVITDDVEE